VESEALRPWEAQRVSPNPIGRYGKHKEMSSFCQPDSRTPPGIGGCMSITSSYLNASRVLCSSISLQCMIRTGAWDETTLKFRLGFNPNPENGYPKIDVD